MNRAALERRVRRAARAMGLPGLVAGALLAMAALLVFVVQPGQQRELDDLRARTVEARRVALQRTGASAVRQAEARRTAFADWLGGLPDPAQRQARVAELLGRAAAHGLVVTRSEYRDASEAGAAGVSRYRVSLPLSGPYDGVRAYLEDVLAADPSLLLDSVRLRRSQPSATQVEADLQFSLLIRDAAAPGARAAGRR